ncbi:hypothetical protein C5167_012338 [Papaver somniferum]|uniref:Uncharacterized protein n=1 Tax=Papaver somniferum TaxID=3469 RepID=A0A4Y7J154_PAPSO|nr:hypothetical protein C5167_012338 [Papaver somniferum]
MEAIEELLQLSESMLQASSVLADEDVDDSSSSSKRSSTFLNVVALGNVVGAPVNHVINSIKLGFEIDIHNEEEPRIWMA